MSLALAVIWLNFHPGKAANQLDFESRRFARYVAIVRDIKAGRIALREKTHADGLRVDAGVACAPMHRVTHLTDDVHQRMPRGVRLGIACELRGVRWRALPHRR